MIRGGFEFGFEEWVEDVADEGAFAGAADAGDADKAAEGNFGGEVFEVVEGGAGEF